MIKNTFFAGLCYLQSYTRRDPPPGSAVSWSPAIGLLAQFGRPPPGLLVGTVCWTGPGSQGSCPWPGSWSCSLNSSVWPGQPGPPTPPRYGSTCLGWNAPEGRRKTTEKVSCLCSKYQATIFAALWLKNLQFLRGEEVRAASTTNEQKLSLRYKKIPQSSSINTLQDSGNTCLHLVKENHSTWTDNE